MSADTVLTDNWFDSVRFDDKGLITAVAQDAHTQRVLMVAWMNAESRKETVRTGYATYYSRSRSKLWRKGEESGNRQRVHSIHLDCDGDTVVIKVHQEGGIACHTGRESCFFHILNVSVPVKPTWEVADAVIKSPHQMYCRDSSKNNAPDA